VFLEEEADVDPTLADDLPDHDELPAQRALPAALLNGEPADNSEPTIRRRRRRRRGRGDRPNPPTTNPKHEDRGP
jgi:hypothetical protein